MNLDLLGMQSPRMFDFPGKIKMEDERIDQLYKRHMLIKEKDYVK